MGQSLFKKNTQWCGCALQLPDIKLCGLVKPATPLVMMLSLGGGGTKVVSSHLECSAFGTPVTFVCCLVRLEGHCCHERAGPDGPNMMSRQFAYEVMHMMLAGLGLAQFMSTKLQGPTRLRLHALDGATVSALQRVCYCKLHHLRSHCICRATCRRQPTCQRRLGCPVRPV